MSLKASFQKFSNVYRENQKTLWFSFYIFLTFITLWGFISITRVGFSNNEDYWYEAGVPILLGQVILALVIGIGFSIAEKKFDFGNSQKYNLIIFFSIWVITAVLWVVQPTAESYMNPAPRLPNQEMYPYSDGIKYDLASQYVLIGQGLNNQKPDDTPLYPWFLSIVHLMSGQNYQNNMFVQSAILALFPSIIYLIGNLLHGRILGIVLASLISMRGINSIAAVAIINTASPKQMLTDFPAALSVAVILLFLLFWFYEQKKSLLILAGASIGFAFLLRATTLVFIGLIPFLVLFPNLINTKRLQIILFISLGFVIVITPWGIRNFIYGNGNTYLQKINLVINERFPETENKQIDPLPKPQENTEESSAQKWKNEKEKTNLRETLNTLNIISNHFVHNVITSTLIFSASPSFNSLDETLKSPYMYWKPYWDGNLSIQSFLLVLISLGILALGIGVTIQKKGMIGCLPLFGFLYYQLGNAIGRTSGGRYIVPVDWILILYFAIGLIEVIFFLTNNRFSSTLKIDTALLSFGLTDNLSRTIIFVLALALLLPLSERVIPLRYDYPEWDRKKIPNNPFFLNTLASVGYTEEQIQTFLTTEKKATLIIGRALYPRYFFPRESLSNPEDAFFPLDYPRLEFILIGPNKKQTIILASQEPVELQNTSDLIILGCDTKDGYIEFIDVIFIIPYYPEQATLLRQPLPLLQCPLPKMVCDNNLNCQ